MKGTYTFRVTVTDNKHERMPDKLTIVIWAGADTKAEPIYKVVNQDMQGGNIQVKAK